MIARHYGALMTSFRDSLHGVMYNDATSQQLLGGTRSTIMADIVHPTATGFKMYGEVLSCWCVFEWAAFVCMSVPVVMGAAEQILTQHARLVVRVLSHCLI
jgi:hypothetical protein